MNLVELMAVWPVDDMREVELLVYVNPDHVVSVHQDTTHRGHTRVELSKEVKPMPTVAEESYYVVRGPITDVVQKLEEAGIGTLEYGLVSATPGVP